MTTPVYKDYKADTLIQFHTEGSTQDGFTIYILHRMSDGFIAYASCKSFTCPFHARELMSYVSDWNDWPYADEEKMEELRAVMAKRFKK